MGDPTTPVDHRQRAEELADGAWQARCHTEPKHELRDLAWAQYHAILAVHDELRRLVAATGIRR
jgi:hypothetical protein